MYVQYFSDCHGLLIQIKLISGDWDGYFFTFDWGELKASSYFCLQNPSFVWFQ
jgi:hypothetical protein